VSWLDWLFVGVCLEDDWKFVVSSTTAQTSWLHRWIMLNRRTFPVDTASPYAVKRMAEYLAGNGRLVLFAEGRMSQTGSLMKLFDGTGFLLHKTHAKVILCYLRGAERVPYSPHPGWKQWFPRVTTHFLGPIDPPVLSHPSATEARTRFTDWLRDQMMEHQLAVENRFGPANLPCAILEAARKRPRHTVSQDATLQPLTYRRLLLGAELIAGRIERAVPQDAARVGVLLPNVNAMPVTLLALWFLGRTPAILNFSSGPAVMTACARLAGLTHIITSRAFLERARLSPDPFLAAGIKLLYLEELRQSIPASAKLSALVRLWFQPRTFLRRTPAGSDTAAVLFTSGSESTPKGVELTHANLLTNVRQILSVLDVLDTDRFFNAMPLFHSFGLTAGLLLPLVRGVYTFLYPSPLHYRMIPTAFYNLNCTVLFGTNTFLNGYARKAHPYDFRTLRYLVSGAEKLQESTARTWSERFGVRILEGYGATECSPAISLSTPFAVQPAAAGRLLPGIQHRIEPVEGVTDGGRLFVRGPNIMKGYLNTDAQTRFLALGGWYDTGDIARVDSRGFVQILGRLKRFAKVSGEMVSLTAVEDALAGAFPQFGLRCQVAILSRPDPEKGEMLLAVANEPKLTLEAIRTALKARGLSNLAIPRELRSVSSIPRLGSGKVDHRELVRQLDALP
jgi:acyl-[acyl-carrier-protein]-phospholipid O-acyltransferase/long-chain-fatty-acid--[acyl-carrier-protein] ligase